MPKIPAKPEPVSPDDYNVVMLRGLTTEELQASVVGAFA